MCHLEQQEYLLKNQKHHLWNICDSGHIEQKNTDPKYLSFVMYILCILVYYYVFLESKSGKDAVELFLHYYSDVSGSRLGSS